MAAAIVSFLALCGPAAAHEGHVHVEEQPVASAAAASPRVAAMSERYQVVGIVEGEVLVLYVDRTSDNAPVTAASLDVTIDGEPLRAELQEKTGTYEVTAPAVKRSGTHEVLVNIADGAVHDLLVGTLVVPPRAEQAGHEVGIWRSSSEVIAKASGAVRSALDKGPFAYAVGALLLLALIGMVAALSRRTWLAVACAVLGLTAASAFALAHEGHDHGPDLHASAGNAPARRPDGTIFLPKPTQRLLQIRTLCVAAETRARRVTFTGRIVPDPNRSGVVQSTIQGRYLPPEGGVPPLGTRVKAGDLLGRVEPSFASIDASDMAQTLGDLDQQISLNRTRLARQEQLLQSNVVARATVEDIRIQIEGLERRRRDLLAARIRPEELRAPVDGTIASARIVAGQVVAQTDQLFQIIDPTRLLVEALLFDQLDPDSVTEATASLAGGVTLKLRFVGRSRALQQQYSILQFEIVGEHPPLNAGTPVIVSASTGEAVQGILLPRAAVVQAPSGQHVVFSQTEPETFVPRAVRTEPFDGASVLVMGGLDEGERVVVQNAGLVNQVR